MATYMYKYDDSEDTFEMTQRMADDPITACPKTGRPVSRIIVPAGGFRIGGGHNATSMWNVSGDPGPRRKGYDCDPMN